MQHTRFLVVGAGISGLSFAHFVDDASTIVLEADDTIGGYCRTVHQDGFTWDYAGHFFHFKHPDIEAWLMSGVEGPLHTVRRVAKIQHRGRLIDYPFQKNIHQLEQSEFLRCLYDLYFRHEAFPPDVPATDFQSLLYQRFGRGITDLFLRPYNEKLYACSLDALDPDAMGRFFPWADTDAIIRNFQEPDNDAYNAQFRYPEGGAIAYVNAIAKRVTRAEIATNEALLHVDVEQRVATTTRRTIRFEHLVSSAPFDRLLAMCGRPSPEGLLRYNQVLVFNLGFDSKGDASAHWVYFPEKAYRFYRVGYYDNIFQTQRMSLYVEIGLPQGVVPDVEAELARVLKDLAEAGVITTQRLVSWHSVNLSPAYVHIDALSQAYVAKTRAELAISGVHSVGRYGGWTYCSMEDNIVEARALAGSLTTASKG